MPRKEQALGPNGQAIIIKYDNRRLYDRGLAQYITQKEVIKMVQSGQKVQILSKRTNADLTGEVLLACIAAMDQEAPVFTVDELHDLIREAPVSRKKKAA